LASADPDAFSLPWSREALAFPEYYNSPANAGPPRPPNMVCTGPITYKGHDLVKRDIENFKAALGSVKPEEAFMPAISPSNVEDRHKNAYYKTDEEFLFAAADAMREEYSAIIEAALVLQLDDARSARSHEAVFGRHEEGVQQNQSADADELEEDRHAPTPWAWVLGRMSSSN